MFKAHHQSTPASETRIPVSAAEETIAMLYADLAARDAQIRETRAALDAALAVINLCNTSTCPQAVLDRLTAARENLK